MKKFLTKMISIESDFQGYLLPIDTITTHLNSKLNFSLIFIGALQHNNLLSLVIVTQFHIP